MIAKALMVPTELESHLQSMIQNLEKLDQSILSKAFRGELVPQDLSDEPASELLARIRATRETQVELNRKVKKKPRSKKVASNSGRRGQGSG